MDSITHIALGAIIGDAFAGRWLGKKSLILGAVAQSLPDIDFVASFWMDTAHDVAAHRGLTHSLLFVFVVGLALAGAGRKIWHRDDVPFRNWLMFAWLEMFIHILLDAFNAYGTGWFEPFSHYRLSFNVLFVADPLFSIWLGIAAVALMVIRKDSRRRWFWIRFGLIIPCCYLYYCLLNKYRIERWAKESLAAQHISYKRYFTTPTPMNNWLWYIVAEDSAGFHTGYQSLLGRRKPVEYSYYLRNDSLLAPVKDRKDVRELLRFSEGYYTGEKWGDTLVLNVLRFGEMRGWEHPQSRFVFHYFVERPDDNAVIVQRGRFAGWDRQVLLRFLEKIKGD